jgi:hypothetical protein
MIPNISRGGFLALEPPLFNRVATFSKSYGEPDAVSNALQDSLDFRSLSVRAVLSREPARHLSGF